MSFDNYIDNECKRVGRTLSHDVIVLLIDLLHLTGLTDRLVSEAGRCTVQPASEAARGGKVKPKEKQPLQILVIIGRRSSVTNIAAVQNRRNVKTIVRLDKPDCATDHSAANNQCPLSLYVFNSASLAKQHALEQLATDLSGFAIDAAVITETHFKPTKHSDSMMNIAGYSLFRKDRQRRRNSSVVIYVHAETDRSPSLQ